MPYDVLRMEDWQVAELAEERMKSLSQIQEEIGLEKDDVIPYGRIGRLDFAGVSRKLNNKPDGKYVVVTAITPTPLGEGKTTTTIGLIQGLALKGKKAGGAIRQPSSGPTMNIKGSAGGGGNSQVIPLTEFSLGLTGDINNIMNAHNLAMVALTARMQHEKNYSDSELARRKLKRLDIDSKNVPMGWVIDFCAQALRNVIIGIGGKMDGYMMSSRFDIAVSSELMAILSIAKDLKDLRERIGDITVAFSKSGTPITTEDLEVAGAMCAFMRESINPTIVQTMEGQPVFVHAGPFANIAIGQSSIIADKVGLKLFDYHVTESGFASDIGFEKFWNVKCRLSGLTPNVAVITVTVRALKMHGGGPRVAPGLPIPSDYTTENLQLLEEGISNLIHHIRTVKMSGIQPVVSLNRFMTDTKEEIALIRRYVEREGAYFAVAENWLRGGEGALELAEAVIDASNKKVDFQFLYPSDTLFTERVNIIARKVYGADRVLWIPDAEVKAKKLEMDLEKRDYFTMMVKTHLSLTHDPELKGVPKGWTLPVRDILVFTGAKFLCPVTGAINLMPGTGSNPAFRRIDVDVMTGKVKGLF